MGHHLPDRGQAADDKSAAMVTTIAPCPRRDAGAFRCLGGDGHHLPDRGQAATHIGCDRDHIAPCPRRDAGTMGRRGQRLQGGTPREGKRCYIDAVRTSRHKLFLISR
jgi:hypothetical protein